MGKVIYIEKFNNNGGKKMNLKTFAKLVLFFANNTKTRLYKTKLNKLLFYTQFLF